MNNSKLWSNLILLASLLCTATIIVSVIGVRMEWFTFRTAGPNVRYAVQAGLVIIALAILLILFARKNKSAVVKGILSLALVLTPLLIIKANMPAGSPIFGAAGPPPRAAADNKAATDSKSKPARPARRTPPLNDISTDTQDPPRYETVVKLRTKGSNGVEYPGASAAKLQQKLFADIKPIQSALDSKAAFSRALEVAKKMGWEIVAQDESRGHIEAVASTTFFNFKDDVVLRIRGGANGSVVDIRSHSRIGRGDRGKNAERVRKFIDHFQND